MRALFALLMSGCLVGCSTSPSVRAPARKQSQRLEVRLATSSYDCLGNATNIAAGLTAETDALASALAAQGVHVARPLRNPTSGELALMLGAEADGPLLWMYSGHGDLVKPGTRTLLTKVEKDSPRRVADSALCLQDGPWPIARLVERLPRSTPFALLIVNACFSADVDIRQAPVDMALISLSTQKSKQDVDGRTPLGQAMRTLVLADLDLDCDGGLSDLEWFAHLQKESTRHGYGAPMLKLRRQTHSLPKLVATRGCHPDLPVEPHIVSLKLEPYRHYGAEHVRANGYVARDTPMVLDGRNVPADELNATGCRSAVGQCFQALAHSPGAM